MSRRCSIPLIKNKFLRKQIQRVFNQSHIYTEIHLNDASKYDEVALQPSINFLEDIYSKLEKDTSMNYLKEKVNLNIEANPLENWKRYECELWDKTIDTEEMYKIHLRSKGHKYKIKGLRMKEKGLLPHSATN